MLRLSVLALTLTGAVVTSATTDYPNRAVYTINATDMIRGVRLRDDCDQIAIRREPLFSQPGVTVIRLETGAGTWWKRLELYPNAPGHLGSRFEISAEGNGRHSTTHLLSGGEELRRAQLVFVKPKFLGWPTAVYQINGLEAFAGQAVTVVWNRDRCG